LCTLKINNRLFTGVHIYINIRVFAFVHICINNGLSIFVYTFTLATDTINFYAFIFETDSASLHIYINNRASTFIYTYINNRVAFWATPVVSTCMKFPNYTALFRNTHSSGQPFIGVPLIYPSSLPLIVLSVFSIQFTIWNMKELYMHIEVTLHCNHILFCPLHFTNKRICSSPWDGFHPPVTYIGTAEKILIYKFYRTLVLILVLVIIVNKIT
jgi:hypothetical protein